MWIALNDAYLSIVKKNVQKGHLLVRARRRGDIERVFPGHSPVEGKGTDYRWRASIPAKEVASAITARILGIEYNNFKDSVKDNTLHDDYMGIWRVMFAAQNREERAERGNTGPVPSLFDGDDDWPEEDEVEFIDSATPQDGKPKKIRLTLVGLNGNAFSLLGAFRNQARREGWTPEEINAVTDEAKSGDYNHLLVTLDAHCDGGKR